MLYHASTWCGLRATLARATFTIKPVIMLACHWSIMQGRDMYHICDHWKPSLEYIATLTVGVEESLNIFERNAGLVREHNTKPGRPPWEVRLLQSLLSKRRFFSVGRVDWAHQVSSEDCYP